ncbi:CaiB/BaiF CoA transferase family protein [Specibacter sp. RAF43]|uniref:CaiB/BaiF CoA transferase family protein n=1 Tax=Specibacter sp. RAF43 TaxID=3233057 RepID=UPI003F9E1D9C
MAALPHFSGPLKGLKVLELSGLGPGPFAAMLLGDLGANVLQIERPGGAASLMQPGNDPMRRNKQAVTIDVRTPEGLEMVLDLAESADVIIEGNRPGVTERLGLGPEDCWKRNPGLVYGRMTGWGQDGPLARTAGHDISYLAITGALHAIGQKDRPPTIPLNLLGDFGGGSLYFAFGLLAAVFEARTSGRGQVIDAAIVDGVISLLLPIHGMMDIDQWKDERGTNLLDSGRPWYDVYPTSDEKYIAVGAIEPKFYAEFMSVLGLDADEEERARPEAWPSLRERIASVIAQRTRQHWESAFEGTDACFAPVLSLEEAKRYPPNIARGTFVEVGGVLQPSPAPRFSRTPPGRPRAPLSADADPHLSLEAWGIGDTEAFLAGRRLQGSAELTNGGTARRREAQV